MPLAKHQDMVKAFPCDRPDQPLTIAILPWRPASESGAFEGSVLLPGHNGYARASDLIRDKALRGRKYIKITDATVRPFLHLLNPTRRPRQESVGFPRR